MARWDPGAGDRLRRAALELYLERGFDAVTVAEIAEHAGLTRRSFFRYFTDKREVLFAGSEQLPAAAAEAILSADESLSPIDAVLEAFAAVGTQMVERLDHVRERRTVINASPELQERERTKFAAITAAISDALHQRGVEPDTAQLLAQTSIIVFQNAFERWIERDRRMGFGDCLHEVATTLREVLTGGA